MCPFALIGGETPFESECRCRPNQRIGSCADRQRPTIESRSAGRESRVHRRHSAWCDRVRRTGTAEPPALDRAALQARRVSTLAASSAPTWRLPTALIGRMSVACALSLWKRACFAAVTAVHRSRFE